MSKQEKISVPDIGGAENVDVIEVLVKPGDQLAKEDPMITLEGDKATMEVPAPKSGRVVDVLVKVGDKVSAGSQILVLESEKSENGKKAQKSEEKSVSPQNNKKEETSTTVKTIKVPDIGGATQVDVIEIAIKKGDKIKKEDPMITLEGDKATMDVPSPEDGIVEAVKLKVGDKVSAGDEILTLKISGGAGEEKETKEAEKTTTEKATKKEEIQPQKTEEKAKEEGVLDLDVHAGPAVRRIAREFGVDLKKIYGSGEKSRIIKEDVQQYVKKKIELAEKGGAGIGVSPLPEIDFSQFGPINREKLTKIKKISGTNLHRNWVTIPHVTQFDEADISEMETFREQYKKMFADQGIRLTPLVFIMKAVVSALKKYPLFNSSLDHDGESLIIKDYYHIGVAVDTPNGLVVPVIRDVDKKGILILAKELGEISEKAREKGLTMKEMQGGCFSISSLGGIGGTAFTPIINAPEVAILGVSKSYHKPIYQNGEFVPRLMLPLSLSYDHRVIDGAEAARFSVYLTSCLKDIRTLLL